MIRNKQRIRFATFAFLILCTVIFISSLMVNYRVYNTLCVDPTGDCLPGQLSHNQIDSFEEVGLSLFQYSMFKLSSDFVQTIGYLIIGFVLLWKRPRNPVSFSAAIILVSLGLGYSSENSQLLHPEFWIVFSMIGFLSNLYILFFYIYPDGRFASKWSILLAVVWITISFGRNWLPGSFLDPFTWPPAAEAIGWIGFHLSSVIILFLKYRKTNDKQQKRQIHWLIYGLTATLLAITMIVLMERVGTQDVPALISELLVDFMLAVAALCLPVTLLIAILFHKLWDINLLLKRAFVYSTLIVISISTYTIVVGTLNALLQTQFNYIVSLIAAGLVAVTFQPLKHQIDKSVHKLIYGDLHFPQRLFNRIGKQFDESSENDTIIHALLETILDSLKFPYAAVQFQDVNEKETEVQVGQQPPILEKISLFYRGQHVGVLLIGNHEHFSKRERQLISDLANHVGIAVYAHQKAEEVVDSRNQIITTREDERRKLRRDLHDGIGPSLATMKLLAEAAKDSEQKDDLLERIEKQAQYSLKSIREIVESLRPTEIDQLGLCHSLENFINQLGHGEVQVEFKAPDSFPVLPAAMEVAIYRITQEAVTNALKHSGCKHCLVDLQFDEHVSLTISDDGTGLEQSNPDGIGLVNMKERVLENGGIFNVLSNPNDGTTIQATFPKFMLEEIKDGTNPNPGRR